METSPNGRKYPSKNERVPNRKQQARLEARIRNFEQLKDVIDDKHRTGYNGLSYTKPGSNKK